MRDVTHKLDSHRSATAQAILKVSPSTIEALEDGRPPKPDPLPTARVAALAALKMTPQLIPYCHPVPIDQASVDFEFTENHIVATVTVQSIFKTGIEMEALTAASVAVLNLYDMLKIIDEEMEILGIKLLSKSGGKGELRPDNLGRHRALVINFSAEAAARVIEKRLEDDLDVDLIEGHSQSLVATIEKCDVDLVVIAGGISLGPTQTVPEQLEGLLTSRLPAVVDAIVSHRRSRQPAALFDRPVAGLLGQKLVIALPGDEHGVELALDAIYPAILGAIGDLTAGE